MRLKILLVLLSLLLVSCREEKKSKVPTTDPYNKYHITQSNTVIDCEGGKFNDGKLTKIIIHSPSKRLHNIVIKNCEILGNIRMYGLGINGEAEKVRESSHSLGHTERAQKAAPTDILISNVKIKEDGDIPVYISPGVTNVKIEDSEFTGKSNSTALYLDAESARNTIVNNIFDINVRREVIAVDGSAYNIISNNKFRRVSSGGIYLYRNCGEGATVRHQSPQFNLIENNHFNLKQLGGESYGIWLGSRNGNRSYCRMDSSFKFGSGLSDLDYASNNTVKGNTFDGSLDRAIRVDSQDNTVQK